MISLFNPVFNSILIKARLNSVQNTIYRLNNIRRRDSLSFFFFCYTYIYCIVSRGNISAESNKTNCRSVGLIDLEMQNFLFKRIVEETHATSAITLKGGNRE